MGLLLVGRGGEGDFFASVTEVTIEPTHEAMDDAVNFHIQLEAAVEVQLPDGYFLKINIVKLETVGEDVLVIDRVHYGLGENPLLHALHADAVDIVPKVLNHPMLTNFFL